MRKETIKFYLDNVENLSVVYPERGYWVYVDLQGFKPKDYDYVLANIDNLSGEEYPISEFEEHECDDEGNVISIAENEITKKELKQLFKNRKRKIKKEWLKVLRG